MLQIEDASIAYGNDVLFSNFNLQLERGEIASISGSSGCGKTSLLNAILGFTPLKEGRITVNDIVSDKNSIDLIRKQIAWIPQELALPLEWVKDMVQLPFSLKANRATPFSERQLFNCFEELGLENISTIHGRAEDFAKKKEYREQFDLCVSRAVANLSTLSEYCLPFVAVNGSFVSYKSGDSEEEIHQAKHAISLLGGKVKNVDKFHLPGTDMGRALVEIKKTKQTPGKYPRKAGLPAKEPLK